MNELILRELIERWQEKAAILKSEDGHFSCGLGSGYYTCANELSTLLDILAPLPTEDLKKVFKDGQ